VEQLPNVYVRGAWECEHGVDVPSLCGEDNQVRRFGVPDLHDPALMKPTHPAKSTQSAAPQRGIAIERQNHNGNRVCHPPGAGEMFGDLYDLIL
jgi:hypothetical protein